MYNLKAVTLEREKKLDGKVNIKFRLSAHPITLYVATEWWIHPSDWNAVAGCMKASKKNPTGTQLNRLIPCRTMQLEDKLAELGHAFQTMI